MQYSFTFKNSIENYSISNTFNPNIGAEEKKLFCSHLEEHREIEFYFDSLSGLVAKNTEDKKNNPLGEFIALTETNLVSYFDKYGFLFDWKSKELYDSISIDDVFSLQNKFRLLIDLFNNIHGQTDFNKLLATFFNYISQSDRTLSLGETELKIKSVYPYRNLRNSLPAKNIDNLCYQVKNDNGTISTFINIQNYYIESGSTSDLNIIDYEDFIDNQNYPQSFRDTIYLYVDKNSNFTNLTIRIIDFLYLFYKYVGVFDFSEYDSNIPNISLETFKHHPELIEFLIDVSKEILAYEINNGLSDVTPKLNSKTFQPDWSLPSLLSAFYFSLFYSNLELSMYKLCENIGCNTPFYIQRSNSLKKYCCESCKNAASQRRYRRKYKKTTDES